MRACVFAAVLVAPAAAFVVPTMTVSEPKTITRKEFASAATAALVAGAAVSPAFAAAGTGPKQSLFGIIGTTGAENSLGGGASSPYAEVETWSPYSPYSNTANGKAAYKSEKDDEAVKFAISVVKDSQKKFEQIPKWVEERKWEEIRAVLTQKSYDMRRSMLKLAKSKDATSAAKAYFKDIENITVSARRKQGAAASDAYAKSVASLNAYLSKL